MAENTKIAWCDHTWNPWWGCEKVSEGCQSCYAEALARRFGTGWGPDAARRTFGASHWKEPLKWDARAGREGRRDRVFCGSMCDVAEDNPAVAAEREKLWPLIRATRNLDWLLLTKRPANLVRLIEGQEAAAGRPFLEAYPNVWAMTTVENQARADERVPIIARLAGRVAVIGLSVEPMLGPVDLSAWLQPGRCLSVGGMPPARCGLPAGHEEARPSHTVLTPDNVPWKGTGGPPVDWVIVGGESAQPGHAVRAFDVNAAVALLGQCVVCGAAAFMKQCGDRPVLDGRPLSLKAKAGTDPEEWPTPLRVRQFPEPHRAYGCGPQGWAEVVS